ncbi:MAG: type II toxin-antitoxin system YoeB family toxin [Bacteroidales bacterium]|jgi:toxin YoeB|nr:type II toxin-antitoxin system YoeB family toxin [Bacteroidales bacterium]
MIYKVSVSKKADRVIEKYRKSNPAAFNKFNKLYEELELHPRTGTGQPEPLTGGQNITYSRRLTANDRIIYDIFDNEIYVMILSIDGHYGDK